jgi:hypothetical protein
MSSSNRSMPRRPNHRFGGRLLVLALLAGITSACSTGGSLKDSWKDPQFTTGPLKNVMVLGIARNPATRKVFEDSFAQSLKARGTPATVSYPALPEAGVIPRDRIQQAMTQSGSDSVLVTRVLRVQRAVIVTAGRGAPDYYRDDFQGWQAQTWSTEPPPIEQYDVLTLESTLWDIRSGKAVWRGTSETTARGDTAAVTADLANLLIARMKADGVI